MMNKGLLKVVLGLGGYLSLTTYISAAQVYATDLVVQGSECVGVDCVSSESFSFDTLRLKENNLRINFDDTSASASFPSNDWRIIINDSSNGGANYFGIEDSTAGIIPFRVEAGAPVNSLYVEDDGDIGIGTSNPVVELHTVGGDTPTLRMEQNGSSGWTPQTWDIAGNETNFFIRDVTNGSKLPFRIKPSAPTDSLFVAADGDIGLGTDSPSSALHLKGSSGDRKIYVQESSSTKAARDLLYLENNGNPQIAFINTSNGGDWRLAGGQTYFNFKNNAGTAVFKLDTSGNLIITGSITTAGTECGSGCDTTFTESEKLPSIEEHAKAMWEESYLPAVGPTKENAPINVSKKVGGILHELEVAHIYIEQLNERLKVREAQLDALIKRVNALEATAK